VLLSRLVAFLAALVLAAGCSAASLPQDGRGPDVENPGDGNFGGGQPGAALPTAAPPAAPGVVAGQQIAWTGRLQLQVADLDASLAAAQSAVSSLGGFVSASRRSGGDRPVASVTYRIPSTRWDEGLTALRRLAVKVLDEQTDSADLATQIVDVEARLRNLRASEAALQAIAAQATRISDVLEVQSRLTEVRGQIESLAAQQAALADRVALGTLVVTFGTEVVAVTQAAKQWDPAREVDAASASLVSFLQQVGSGLIWFAIVWLPILVFALVLLLVLRFGWRRIAPRVPRLPARPEPAYAWVPGWPGGQGPASAPAASVSPPPGSVSSPGPVSSLSDPAAPTTGPGTEKGTEERADRPGG
jgi:hypothetical protein